jgi:hypothetical protein
VRIDYFLKKIPLIGLLYIIYLPSVCLRRINPTPIVISNFYESSVSELDTLLRDRTFNMRPILAKVSVDNYPEVCAWDSLCVIVPVRPNEIETLHRLRGSISVSVLQLVRITIL